MSDQPAPLDPRDERDERDEDVPVTDPAVSDEPAPADDEPFDAADADEQRAPAPATTDADDDQVPATDPRPEDLPTTGESDVAAAESVMGEQVEGDLAPGDDQPEATPAVDESAEPLETVDTADDAAPEAGDPAVATADVQAGAEDVLSVGEREESTPDAGADELDKLLGMAGATTAEDVDAAADETVGPTAEEPAAAQGAEEVGEQTGAGAAQPAVRPRPKSLADVRDRRDLARLVGDWYVVHTYAGYEQRVRDNLTNRVESLDAQDRVFEVVIPTEEVTEYKKGKKTTSQKKFLPGYVLVRMDMDDETWGIVRHTPAVTGFVGPPGSRPVPLPLREVSDTLKLPAVHVEETEEAEREVVPERTHAEIDLDVGETIRVTSGPFADFTGTIAEINLDQAKLKVLVSVFGRETPLELPFDNVAKL